MASRLNLRRRTSSLESIQQQPAAEAAASAASEIATAAAAAAAIVEETEALIPPDPPAAGAAATQPAADPSACFCHRRLLRRNSSTPCFSGNYSKVAHKLGVYVDECVYHAFMAENARGRELCVNYVTEVLQSEILLPVLSDLQVYRSDLNFEQFDFSNARLILSNLEYRVATVRDRLLYPFRYQQVMDLSHLCGCIHSVRMRLGFLTSRQEAASASSVA